MAPGGCKTRAVVPQPAGGCVPLPRRLQCCQRGGAIPRHLFPNARFPFGARSLSNDLEAGRRPCFFFFLSFPHHSNAGLSPNPPPPSPPLPPPLSPSPPFAPPT